MEKSEKTTENKFQLVEVPTQMGIAFKTPEGQVMGMEDFLVLIANELREVKKALA